TLAKPGEAARRLKEGVPGTPSRTGRLATRTGRWSQEVRCRDGNISGGTARLASGPTETAPSAARCPCLERPLISLDCRRGSVLEVWALVQELSEQQFRRTRHQCHPSVGRGTARLGSSFTR